MPPDLGKAFCEVNVLEYCSMARLSYVQPVGASILSQVHFDLEIGGLSALVDASYAFLGRYDGPDRT